MLTVHRAAGRTTLIYRGTVRGLRRWLAASRHTLLAAWPDLLRID